MKKSRTIDYDSFLWPSPTDAQRAKIEKTAQGILDAPPVMAAPACDAPEGLDSASVVGMRLERDGERLFGALDDAPAGITELSLGIRENDAESWFSAFPVSGVEDDGDWGFSALLDNIPDTAEVCVFMRGDKTLRTDWTPVSEAILP